MTVILPAVTIILRGVDRGVADAIVGVIADHDLDLAVEITSNSTNFTDLRRYVEQYPQVQIGAGTIVTMDDALAAIDTGCGFVLSPVLLDADVIDACHDADLAVVSGAFTPTEIREAAERGSDIVKVFPINAVPPRYVRDVRAPLGPIPIMGVGGVTRANIDAYLDAGVDYLGIGSGLSDRPLAELTATQLEETLRALVR